MPIRELSRFSIMWSYMVIVKSSEEEKSPPELS